VRVPRPEQVRALQLLIFRQYNILLIARTGFKKSLIFHAYSILTRKITIQLIPLTKLREEQLSNIQRFHSARPCLINTKIQLQEKDILQQIKASQYTHILLGPEQASSQQFHNILQTSTLQARIRLVALNKYHLVVD
jgi:superfamily II DNA helicase RecQ